MSPQPEPARPIPFPPVGFPEEVLAVFDLDGTLIKGDSFLPFLITYARRGRRVWPIIVLPFYLALYVCRILSDRDAKERLIGSFFGKEPMRKIIAHSEWFCSGWVQKRLRSDSMKKLREHQAAGHRVILVSASPDLFVPQIGKFLGINETVCTRIAFEDGYCSGKLAGANCKGDIK
jgi:phosphatidylglycerophosphatase C